MRNNKPEDQTPAFNSTFPAFNNQKDLEAYVAETLKYNPYARCVIHGNPNGDFEYETFDITEMCHRLGWDVCLMQQNDDSSWHLRFEKHYERTRSKIAGAKLIQMLEDAEGGPKVTVAPSWELRIALGLMSGRIEWHKLTQDELLYFGIMDSYIKGDVRKSKILARAEEIVLQAIMTR